jgi:chitinase
LISVGGVGWSGNFLDMAYTAASRKRFAKRCVRLVQKYNLDGIDIDWEFPGYPGDGGNKYRPEDKSNYTLLFKALRSEFDSVTAKDGKKYLLTTAVSGWGSHFLPHTEMDQVQKYADFILIMAYNFNTPELVGGHFLHSPANWPAEGSAEGAIQAFMAAGVPAAKLVLGAGFFPAAFVMATDDSNDRHYLHRLSFHGGLARVNQMINKAEFKEYWDEVGQSPFLFNSTTKTRISYENERSVSLKAAYIKDKKLAGLMYWDYFSDPGKKLLSSAYQVFSSP